MGRITGGGHHTTFIWTDKWKWKSSCRCAPWPTK